jgi:ribonuclease R
MDDDYYIFNEKTFSLVGKEYNRTFRLGDEVKIKVKQVEREKNQIDFSII